MMPNEIPPNLSLTRSFLTVLYPLLRIVNAERTISPGKIGILRHLTEHGRATTSELAVAIQVSPQGISLAVREMERLALVARIPDTVDRRKAWIVLTEAGIRKLAEESSAGYGTLDRAIRELLTDEERRTLEAAIPILRRIGAEGRAND